MNLSETKTARNYGIDALRILAMYMIVVLHVLGKGGVLAGTSALSAQYETAWFLETAAMCAVNCYALISGYVGIDAEYRVSNLVMVWLRVVFYTLSITIIFKLLSPGQVGISSLIKAFFPMINRTYWYVTAYFCLFLFLPILNKGILALSMRQLRFVVYSIVAVFSVVQTFYAEIFYTQTGYSGLWLIVLYIVGAYLKKSDAFHRIRPGIGLLSYVIFIVLSWGVKWIKEDLFVNRLTEGTRSYRLAAYIPDLVTYISPTILFAAIALLAVFAHLQMSGACQKVIGFLAPLAFSVYLIHVNGYVFHGVISERFAPLAGRSPIYLAGGTLLYAFAIFIICSAIDLIREGLFRGLKLKAKSRRIDAFFSKCFSDDIL